MRICIQFSYPEDADLIWLRNVAGRRFPGVIRECLSAWADGLSFVIDTPLEVPASTPVPHESVKTILFIEDGTPVSEKLGRAEGKPALIRNLLRSGAGQMFTKYADAIWGTNGEPLAVDVKIPKKYADSFVSENFRSPGDYERSLYAAVSALVNGTAFDRAPVSPDDVLIMPASVTVRFDRERDGKIIEVLSGIPEPLRGCFLRSVLHTAVAEAERKAGNRRIVTVSGKSSDASAGGASAKRPSVHRMKDAAPGETPHPDKTAGAASVKTPAAEKSVPEKESPEAVIGNAGVPSSAETEHEASAPVPAADVPVSATTEETPRSAGTVFPGTDEPAPAREETPADNGAEGSGAFEEHSGNDGDGGEDLLALLDGLMDD